ncbi:MAG: 2-haloalkanoic acid dehalogenase [Myxococcales bacterium]|nr:2-haloalkanoic acid dehalogenase [Myxococcales bacterium]
MSGSRSGPSGDVDDVAAGVRLLSLDAGNTIVFLDHRACAEIVASALARAVDDRALERAEGLSKRRLDLGTLLPPLPDADITPAWGAFMATMVQLGTGVDDATAAECARALWREHRRFNLWRTVPDGLVDGVRALRKAGVPVVVVSNSEGQLEVLFAQLGLAGEFDLVIDSHVAGVEKPDPRIFQIALERAGVAARDALHLGDTFATDVVGARAAGVRVALIDPFAHYDGQYPDVPRVAGVAAVCRAIVSALT